MPTFPDELIVIREVPASVVLFAAVYKSICVAAFISPLPPPNAIVLAPDVLLVTNTEAGMVDPE
jgi:hypothetical protein